MLLGWVEKTEFGVIIKKTLLNRGGGYHLVVFRCSNSTMRHMSHMYMHMSHKKREQRAWVMGVNYTHTFSTTCLPLRTRIIWKGGDRVEKGGT